MQSSLYDRLGGKDAITAVVDDFVATCANDSRINAKFAKSDVPRLKAMLVDQGVRGHGRTVHVLRSRHDGDPQGVASRPASSMLSSKISCRRSAGSASLRRSKRSSWVCSGP